MIQQLSNIVDKEWVQKLCYLFSVRKVQSTFERDPITISLDGHNLLVMVGSIPDTLQMHRSNLDDMTCFLALENAITTTSGHSRNVQKLGTVDHVII